MDSKIQELTEKVYKEGVLKGNEEAKRLVQEAEERASQLLKKAEDEARAIVKKAETEAEALKQNTQRELKQHAAQVVEATRASLTEAMTGQIATRNVEALSADPQFIQGVVLEIVKGFDLNKGVEVSTSQAEALHAYFAKNARHLLESGLSIKSVAGKPTEFTVKPQDGGFKLEIGEREFLELFKSLLRPQLAEQLF